MFESEESLGSMKQVIHDQNEKFPRKLNFISYGPNIIAIGFIISVGRNSSVGIMTRPTAVGPTIRGEIPGREEIPSLKRPEGLWGPLNLLFSGY